MAAFVDNEVSLAFDLHGCPNRCRHCWLGCASRSPMDLAEAVKRFESFREYIATGAELPHLARVRYFGSWFREPDYADDYRDLYETELRLGDGQDQRKDYELLSIWRLARDESYAWWARDTGVKRCQVTFFGLEETTDWFYRRKGAFNDAILATQRLLENGIVPRWQLFQSRKILRELSGILSLVDNLRLREKAHSLGEEFVIFMHDPSPIGQARMLEDLRITKPDLKRIPRELIDSTCRHMKLSDPYRTEVEWLARISAEDDVPVGAHRPTVLWFFVDAKWDVYPNICMDKWWRLGNIRSDPPARIVRAYREDETPGQRALYGKSRKEIASRFGDPKSNRIYMAEEDLLDLYLERYLRSAQSMGGAA